MKDNKRRTNLVKLLLLFAVLVASVSCMFVRSGFSINRAQPDQHDLNRALLSAIRRDNAEEVARLLHKGADPKAHEEYSDSPPYISARPGLSPLARIKMLLHGKNKHVTVSRTTLLHTALNSVVDTEHVPSNPAIVNLLVRAGADVNVVDENGSFPLLDAADTLQCDLVKLLLDYGADVNKVDPVRGSALSIAAMRGDLATIALLLQRGANINLMNAYGWTPLMSAAQGGNKVAVLFLLEHGAMLNNKNCLGEDALAVAIRNELPVTARILRNYRPSSK